MREIAMPR